MMIGYLIHQNRGATQRIKELTDRYEELLREVIEAMKGRTDG